MTGALSNEDALLRRRKRVSAMFGVLCAGATALCLLILIGLLATVAVNAFDAFLPEQTRAELEGKSTLEGLGARTSAFFSAPYWQRGWTFLVEGPSWRPEKAGVNPAIFGSLWLIGLTALFSVPAGVGAAVYLEEYAAASRWKQLVQLNIANLAGVPSIVYGILGLGIFVRAVTLQAPGGDYLVGLSLGRVILSGALTLSLVVLPIVILASQEALRAVPRSIRQASYALGATKWQTTWRQVLPAALPGMMTGVILAISRALGEAAPLVAVGAVGFINYTPTSPYSRFTALPLQIFNWAADPKPEFHSLASAAILVLLAVLIMMNAAAVWVRYHYGQRIRWQPCHQRAQPRVPSKHNRDMSIKTLPAEQRNTGLKPPRVAQSRASRSADELAASAPKISVSSLNFYYGSSQALYDINLTVPEHCVTAFIGPSGCGKSTFLRCMNRMNDMIEGTRLEGDILLDSHDINAARVDVVSLRKRVGMVFQKSNPFPKSILENVVYGPRVAGERSKNRLMEIAEQCLERAALWHEVKDRLNDSALALSGGQQQRLCIARALATDPEVLLMDEPASALDPASTSRIEDLIFELKDRYTIVIVTHNMQQAARVSDQTAFFFQGELVEAGRTNELFTNPSKKQTEDYITGRFG